MDQNRGAPDELSHERKLLKNNDAQGKTYRIDKRKNKLQ